MNSSILYRGEVTILTKHNGKTIKKEVIHNTGKAPLFNFLVDCLAGDFSTRGVPRYLGIYNETGGTVTQVHYQLTPASSIDKKLAITETEASVEYTFLVSGANLKPELEGNIVRLFNSNNMGGENESAEITGVSLEGTSVAAGISYVVIWKLTIANQTQSALALS